MTPSWREELKQLANIESKTGCAVSFYFDPEPPQDKSHRGEAILVKDLVRDAIKNMDRNEDHNGNGATGRADLQRIAEMAEQLHNNHSRAKAIFACSENGFWKEFDLPAGQTPTSVHVNSRFHLTPLSAAVNQISEACVVLLDRENARILDLKDDQLVEKESIHNDLPRRGRGDGFKGYEGGHLERHVENEAMRHFKETAERLQDLHSNGQLATLIIGCRAELWSEIEPHLHAYVKQALVQRVDLDPTAPLDRVREEAFRILDEHRTNAVQASVREVMGQAQRNGLGSIGLSHVITSLERGEVQHLLIGKDFEAKVVECSHCGHLDTRRVSKCAVCAQEVREVEDANRALIGQALRHGAEILYVEDDEEFKAAGNVAALLRFRADQNTPAKLATSETAGTGERAAS